MLESYSTEHAFDTDKKPSHYAFPMTKTRLLFAVPKSHHKTKIGTGRLWTK